jgi:hypothetical protein
LTFALWLLYRPLTLEAEPAVLTNDSAPDRADPSKEIA